MTTHMGLISTARATSRVTNCCPKNYFSAWTSETWGVERFWFNKVFASALFEIHLSWSKTLSENVQSTMENDYSEIISEGPPQLWCIWLSNVQLWQYFGNNSGVNLQDIRRASTRWHEDTVAASSIGDPVKQCHWKLVKVPLFLFNHSIFPVPFNMSRRIVQW